MLEKCRQAEAGRVKQASEMLTDTGKNLQGPEATKDEINKGEITHTHTRTCTKKGEIFTFS